MDVLSSQANLAGYKAVLDAAAEFGRAFPMMMTAAGTIKAARVLVMGAGVAGLQAIATARRLGAIVSASDVRAAAKEQVESLGASFISVDEEAARAAETAGGYAREMDADYQRRQREKIAEALRRTDIVICTALVPGRRAPVLLTEAMVAGMAPGSVIVDLAVDSGGNVEGSRPGEVAVTANGVRIVGHVNMPSRIAVDASQLYARNLLAFLALIVDKEGHLRIDTSDEIVKAALLTQDGAIVNPAVTAEPAAAAPGATQDTTTS
jgi:NAD(P) transhydrogenase subunit alpha